MTIKCCKCFAANHFCCYYLGVGHSQPTDLQPCYTPIVCSLDALSSARVTPGTSILLFSIPASSCRVAGFCWSPSQLFQGEGRLLAPVKDKQRVALTNPTVQHLDFYRVLMIEAFIIYIISDEKNCMFTREIKSQKDSAPQSFREKKKDKNNCIRF